MTTFQTTYHLTGGEKIPGASIKADTAEEAVTQALLPLTNMPSDSAMITITTEGGDRIVTVMRSAIVAVTVEAVKPPRGATMHSFD